MNGGGKGGRNKRRQESQRESARKTHGGEKTGRRKHHGDRRFVAVRWRRGEAGGGWERRVGAGLGLEVRGEHRHSEDALQFRLVLGA